MRKGEVYYKQRLARLIQETPDGEYVFKYESEYVSDYADDFLVFSSSSRIMIPSD